MHDTDMKYCPDCGEDRPVSEFAKDRSRPDGLQFYCKACANRRCREWREHRAGTTRACAKCKRVLPPDAFNGGHAYCKGCASVVTMQHHAQQRNYAPPLVNGEPLTGPQYEAFFEQVGGKCENPECDSPAECLDHDHETGEVRGVLCRCCNVAEGMLGSIAKMQGLIAYREAHG